ncbi:FG-GAP-like repeat-containing protein [Streptomyces filamentosus]|uniref:Bulb-type lectin domain-containing protein n=1 Tax=Streptomyces filamentosus TaxID=67294 RepID=A0A919BH00_STRFL|nr:FG-GAP-like repeat-containing protein [Streptomyces filamentosus]GHF87402.1 hypothetical protein GCM10017667_14960 [Streptomyces filamentosus]
MAGTLSAVPVGATQAAAAVAEPSDELVSTDDVTSGLVSEEDAALRKAAETGQPVEVLDARTESTETWAQPDGDLKRVEFGVPVRLWRDDAWVAADPTLEFAADGSVVTRATSVAVKFSGGGAGALIEGSQDGRTLSLTWPKALPKPVLEGNIATYAEVLPGVDLQVKAEVEGFSQVFVVKSAEAARNPELVQLQFGIQTDGLTVEKDAETGSLIAKDPTGQTIFSSAAPMMWDSTTTAPPAPAAGAMRAMSAEEITETGADGSTPFDPAVGAQDAVMPTELTSESLTITPDQDLLTGTETTYPVYIDPSWGYGDGQKWNWARVYQRYPSWSEWNAKGSIRVGYEAQTGTPKAVSRSFLQLDISHLKGVEVKSATLRLKNIWSWSCTDADVYLYPTGAIHKGTNWNNQPGKLTSGPLDTVRDAKGWSADCPAGNLEFKTDSWVRSQAAAGKDTVTFGLYADEGDTRGWKKFDPTTVVLETEYNTRPDLPDLLGTNPVTPCGNAGKLGNVSVSLHARVKDGDKGNLKAQFEVYENKGAASTRIVNQSIPVLNGRLATLALPVSLTPGGTGVTYSWRVQAIDQDGSPSGWRDGPCSFQFDRQRPMSAPKIVSPKTSGGVPVYPPGDTGVPAKTGKARTNANFTFETVKSDGITKVYWWTDTDPDTHHAAVVGGGVFGGQVRIPSYGPHMIYAYGLDAAGNRSDTATYLYYAAKESKRDELNDLNGDRFKDIWSADSNGTLLAYMGQGDREFSTLNATSRGATFPGGQIATVPDWQEDGYNDLVALVPNPNENNAKDLLVYKNNGLGVVNSDEGPVRLTAYHDKNYWKQASQVLAADLIPDPKNAPDVLIKEGKLLWLYRGSRSNVLGMGKIVPVGTGTDWSKYTLALPGDVNGDGLPDLLIRDDATGDVFRSHATPDPANGKMINFTTWGRDRFRVATGLTKARYPQIGTSGDLDGTREGVVDGDKIMDLWARKADNSILAWRGKGTTTNRVVGNVTTTVTISLTGFEAPYTIEGINSGIRLEPMTVIQSGGSISGQASTLTMRADGKLIITNKTGAQVWNSPQGPAGTIARIENDGDIALLDKQMQPVWSTAVGNTKEGFAVIQDSGNVVVYNDKSESLWSSGTSARHDYNRDSRSDIADWYDYGDGHDELHTFSTNSDGSFQAPVHAWTTPAGNYWAENMKRTTGDFNGDGIGDIAAFYGYEDGGLSLRTWTGRGDGKFNAPFTSWTAPKGAWNFDPIHVQSGDFNGDGRDDIATWYAYGDGQDKLFTFISNIKGGFNYPFSSFYRSSGWDVKSMKFATGDFNQDGRTDIGALYGYANGDVKLFTFPAKVDGGFDEPIAGWSSSGWTFSQASIHAGDFNNDGRDDIMSWYDYGDGHDAIIGFNPSDENGKFLTRDEIWNGAAGRFWRQNMKIVTGDFNGDGRDDVGAMYGYENGSVKMFTWLAAWDSTNGAYLKEPIYGWEAPSGAWYFNSVHMIERYSPA